MLFTLAASVVQIQPPRQYPILLYTYPESCNLIGPLPLNNKQLLHTPPLNTMKYLHEVVDISRGRRPSEIFTTEGMVFNGEGCATIVLLYTYTESVEEKIL